MTSGTVLFIKDFADGSINPSFMLADALNTSVSLDAGTPQRHLDQASVWLASRDLPLKLKE